MQTNQTIPDSLENPDDLYHQLIDIYESFDEQQSTQFSQTLIFLLANEVGNAERLKFLVEEAHRITQQPD